MMSTILAILLSSLLRRLPWINHWHEQSKERFRIRYKKSISFQAIRIKSFNRFSIVEPAFADETSGYSFTAKEIAIQISLRHLMNPARAVRGLWVNQAVIGLTSKKRTEPAPQASIASSLEQSYWRLSRLLKKCITLIPPAIELTDCSCCLDAKAGTGITLQRFSIQDERFMIEGSLQQKGITQSVTCAGTIEGAISSGRFTLHTTLLTAQKQSADATFALSVQDATCQADFHWTHSRDWLYRIEASSSSIVWQGQPLVHSKDGSKGLEVLLTGSLNEVGFEVKQGSAITFNHLHLAVQFIHPFSATGSGELACKLSPCSVEELLQSFPGFRYRPVYSATFSGLFGFAARLKIALQPPYQYDFKVDIEQDIRLLKRGDLNLNYLKQPFAHAIHHQGSYLRDCLVGKENNNFVPLSKCARYFRQAILLCEDRNFYQHQGIDLPSIGLAIVTNLATRKFSKGASTITMQVTRNLFLYQSRSLFKKMEEVLLSWLVEVVFAVSKDRLLEIYLNIIEFAPGVYGIGEAAQFYFGKTAEALSITECLVLTYVVPRPRHFIEALENGSLVLAENLANHIDSVLQEMRSRELIQENELRQMQQEIEFANGLGKIHLKNRGAQLHPTLYTLYMAAAALWRQRHHALPRPFISCTYRSNDHQQRLYNRGRTTTGTIVTKAEPGMSPHNYLPSLAFDITFRNELGVSDWSEPLYVQFAQLIDEVDTSKEVVWGGCFTALVDMPHFELRNWKALANAANNQIRYIAHR